MILPFEKNRKQLNEINLFKLIGGGHLAEQESSVEIPAGNHKLFITKSVNNFDAKKAQITADFIKFCCKNLGINQPCKVYFTGKRGGSTPVQTLASFNPNNYDIWVYVNDRMLADCLRSLAHELTHYNQCINNLLTPESGEDGSEHENEANSTAGIHLRMYGRMHPEIYK